MTYDCNFAILVVSHDGVYLTRETTRHLIFRFLKKSLKETVKRENDHQAAAPLPKKIPKKHNNSNFFFILFSRESRAHCVDIETAYMRGCEKLDQAVMVNAKERKRLRG